MPTPAAVRADCYKRIRTCLKQGLDAYYRTYPERAFDERSAAALQYSVAGLEHIFQVLDGFDIRRLPKQGDTE